MFKPINYRLGSIKPQQDEKMVNVKLTAGCHVSLSKQGHSPLSFVQYFTILLITACITVRSLINRQEVLICLFQSVKLGLCYMA